MRVVGYELWVVDDLPIRPLAHSLILSFADSLCSQLYA